MRLFFDTLSRNRVILSVIIGAVAYISVINIDAFDDPPAWDSAITVSPAALTIVDYDFDVWAVAQLPSSPLGGPSTHATSIYTIGLALLIFLLGPSGGFLAAHVISVGLAGALAAATYLLARERAPVSVSAVAAAAIAVLPLVVQQAADVYLDLPLAVVATLACWATVRRRFWLVAGLILLGVAIKTSGIFLLPLLLLARPEGKSIPRHLGHTAVAGIVASTPLLLVLATTHRFATEMTPAKALPLLRSSFALLVLTIDVFLVLAATALVTYGRARSRTKPDPPAMVALVMTASFFAVHVSTMVLSGTIAILPRYYIAILPAVLVSILPVSSDSAATYDTPYRVGVGMLILLVGFSLMNVRGDLYPDPDHDFFVVAERSTRAQDLLELQVLGTRELDATGMPILAERQVHFRLKYPGMGYVDDTPAHVTSIFLETTADLPDTFAMLIERRYTNPLVEIEERSLNLGYDLNYRELRVGGFQSQLIIASKPED